MKVAFHFDERHPAFKYSFFLRVVKALFPVALKLRAPIVDAKVVMGTVPFLTRCRDRLPSNNPNSHTKVVNTAKLKALINDWKTLPRQGFSTLADSASDTAANGVMFAFCFSSIDPKHAKQIDKSLKKHEWYLGAIEVDDLHAPHVSLYPHGLVALGRIRGREFQLYWDGFTEESKDASRFELLEEAGFSKVTYESLNGRYTIFDTRHSAEETIRSAAVTRMLEGLLSGTAERVLDAFVGVAPSLPEKLHAALKAFQNAETAEELAHVSLSCRRIIEYTANCVFPPQDKPSPDGRKLDKSAYRNRLLRFADVERSSDTAVDLIVASTSALAEQWERLDIGVNKGLHADALEPEVRRCLVRTILLLDDLLSLRTRAFPNEPEVDFSEILPLARSVVESKRKRSGRKSPG